MRLEELIVIASEAILSLYPILIKLVDTDISTQMVARFATFAIGGALLASPQALKKSWGSPAAAAQSFGLGCLSLAHVAASYYAFQQLPAGVAMSLFYTYPVMNVLVGMLGLREAISPFQIGLVTAALLGVVLVSFGSHAPANAKEIHWKGIASALAAAATETAMYFAVKEAALKDVYFSILQLYPGGLIALGAILAFQGHKIDMRLSTWTPMLLFNFIVGFIGYAIRYYAIPKVSIGVFSVLSFVGVVASFIYGFLFVGEHPTLLSSVGAALISGAAALAS
jgi:drug/metabolite transporter (DMT)-like permease